MRAEPVDEIAEQCAGRSAIRFLNSHRLKLNESIAGSDAALEFRLERIQLLPFFVPHEFDITNRAGIVEQQEEVLEEFQIFLKFPPQSSAQDSMLLFQVKGPQDEQELYYRHTAENTIKRKVRRLNDLM
jgi:hypothetical protein